MKLGLNDLITTISVNSFEDLQFPFTTYPTLWILTQVSFLCSGLNSSFELILHQLPFFLHWFILFCSGEESSLSFCRSILQIIIDVYWLWSFIAVVMPTQILTIVSCIFQTNVYLNNHHTLLRIFQILDAFSSFSYANCKRSNYKIH